MGTFGAAYNCALNRYAKRYQSETLPGRQVESSLLSVPAGISLRIVNFPIKLLFEKQGDRHPQLYPSLNMVAW